MEIKINKNGTVRIPKKLRDEINLEGGITLCLNVYGNSITLRPKFACTSCGAALPDELADRGACVGCKPSKRETVYVY